MIVQKINNAIHATVEPYLFAIDSYSNEQFTHKESEEIWSLGQLYEHIILSSNYFFLANILRCVEKRKGQEGGDKNAYGDNAFQHNGLRPQKFKVPEVGPTTDLVAQSKENYDALLQKVLKDTDDLLPVLTSAGATYKTMHFAFGWLNAPEWYQMLEMHLRHHHRQQKELEGFAGIIYSNETYIGEQT